MQKSGAPEIQAAATEALAKIGSASLDVDALLESLRNPAPVQSATASAIARAAAGPDGEAIRSALLKLLSSEQATDRRNAVRVLGQVQFWDAQHVAPLIRLIHSDDPEVTSWVAIALGNMGPAARSAVPYLCAVRRNEVAYNNEDLVRTVENAVRRIQER